MYTRLTSVPNRTLLYDVYQYVWDAKETTMLLDSYIAWLGMRTGWWEGGRGRGGKEQGGRGEREEEGGRVGRKKRCKWGSLIPRPYPGREGMMDCADSAELSGWVGGST